MLRLRLKPIFMKLFRVSIAHVFLGDFVSCSFAHVYEPIKGAQAIVPYFLYTAVVGKRHDFDK